ncbi:MAG: acetate/propionate family kinase [Deltaproteobacteria bacterium]|nr:acetate/propionate family kinase [Deltaproteobacteria bacterium]
MRIVVFNCGSSSLKYRLIDMPSETELAAGEAERVGPKTALPGCIHHRAWGCKEDHPQDMPDHGAAFAAVMRLLERDVRLVPEAIGHRMVHGGAVFHDHVIVDEQAFGRLEEVQDLAPIHNPPALRLLGACRQLYPKLPETVVFDTAFHSTIAPAARIYALPGKLARTRGFRKYGFHGTSHRYVAEEAAKLLGIPVSELCAVSCHLGSGGASLCAIVDGKSVDNTMGYSPLQGLVMSTRSGDLDPAIALALVARAQGDSRAVESLLNRKSGLLGLSGVSADIRDLVGGGAQAAALARAAQVYLWRIRKYLGAYLLVTGRPHCIIFTDTVGEKMPYVRWAVTAGLDALGVVLDARKNGEAASLPVDLAAPQSRVRILAIATNEEIAIARASFAMLARAEGLPS